MACPARVLWASSRTSFDRLPGTEGYSPLRRVHFVRWVEGRAPRELRSAQAVREAELSGEVTIERTSSVVNMPIVSWPGGRR